MPTTISLPLLDRVQIAAPCDARWEEMTGDERKRLCAECNLHVHNIAGLTRDEAEALLRRHFNPDGSSKGERFCGRLFRRADGTILTQDCPKGLAKLRAATHRAAARVAVALGLSTFAAVALGWIDQSERTLAVSPRLLQPIAPVLHWLAQAKAVPTATGGRVAIYTPQFTGGFVVIPPPSPLTDAPAPPAVSSDQPVSDR
jgi:hypothetical protein